MSTATSRLSAFSPAAIKKATALIESGRVNRVENTWEYLSTGSDGVSRYITDAYRETCTCPAGTFGRTCSHLVAAVALMEGTR